MNLKDGKLVFEKPFRVEEAWVYDANGIHVLADGSYGYLTGGRGLNLPEDEAIEVQDDFLAHVVKCLNSHDALTKKNEMLEDAVRQLLEVHKFYPDLPPRANPVEIKHAKMRKIESDSAVDAGREALRFKENKVHHTEPDAMTEEIWNAGS